MGVPEKYSAEQFYGSEQELLDGPRRRKLTIIQPKSSIIQQVDGIDLTESNKFIKSMKMSVTTANETNLNMFEEEEHEIEQELSKVGIHVVETTIDDMISERHRSSAQMFSICEQQFFELDRQSNSKVQELLNKDLHKRYNDINICVECNQEYQNLQRFICRTEYQEYQQRLKDEAMKKQEEYIKLRNMNSYNGRMQQLMEEYRLRKIQIQDEINNKIQCLIDEIEFNQNDIFEKEQLVQENKEDELELQEQDEFVQKNCVIQFSDSQIIQQYIQELCTDFLKSSIMVQNVEIEKKQIFRQQQNNMFSVIRQKELLQIDTQYIIKSFCVISSKKKTQVIMGTIDGRLLKQEKGKITNIEINNETNAQIEQVISCKNIRNSTKFEEYVLVHDIMGGIYLVDIEKNKLKKKYNNDMACSISKLAIFSNTDLRFIYMQSDKIVVMRIQRYQLYNQDIEKYKVEYLEDGESNSSSMKQSRNESQDQQIDTNDSLSQLSMNHSLSKYYFVLKGFEILLMKCPKNQQNRQLVKQKLIALVGGYRVRFGLIKPKYRTLKLKLELENDKCILNNELKFIQDLDALKEMQIRFVFIDSEFRLCVYQLQFFLMIDSYSNSQQYELDKITRLQMMSIGVGQIDKIYFKNNNQLFLKNNRQILQTNYHEQVRFFSSYQIDNQSLQFVMSSDSFQNELYLIIDDKLYEYSNKKQCEYFKQLMESQQYEIMFNSLFHENNMNYESRLEQSQYQEYIRNSIDGYLEQMKDEMIVERSNQIIQILIANRMDSFLFGKLYNEYKKYQIQSQFYTTIQKLTQNKRIRFIEVKYLDKIVDDLNNDEHNMTIIETLLINLDIHKYEIDDFLKVVLKNNLIKAIIIIANKYMNEFELPWNKMVAIYQTDKQVGKYIIQYLKSTVMQEYIDGQKIEDDKYKQFIDSLIRCLKQQYYIELLMDISQTKFLAVMFQMVDRFRNVIDDVLVIIQKILDYDMKNNKSEEIQFQSMILMQPSDNQIENYFLFYLYLLTQEVIVSDEQLQIQIAIRMLSIYSHNVQKINTKLGELNINAQKISQLYVKNVIDLGMTTEQASDLIKFSDMISLDQLCSELYFKQKRFIKSIEQLLKSKDTKYRNQVFEQIKRVFQFLNEYKQPKDNDNETFNVRNAQEQVHEYFSQVLIKLIDLNSKQTYKLIQQYHKEKQNEFIHSLSHDPKSQLQLIQNMIQDYKQENNSQLCIDQQFDHKNLEIYFKILAQNKAQQQIIRDMKYFQTFRINQLIDDFAKHGLTLTLSYVYEYTPDLKKCIGCLFDLIDQYFQDLIEIQKPSLDDYFANRDKESSKCLEENLQIKFIEDKRIKEKLIKIFAIFQRVLDICEKSEQIDQNQWDNALCRMMMLLDQQLYAKNQEQVNVFIKIINNKISNQYLIKIEQVLPIKEYIEKIRLNAMNMNFDQCKDSLLIVYGNMQFKKIMRQNAINLLKQDHVDLINQTVKHKIKGEKLQYHCYECGESLNRNCSYTLAFRCGYMMHLSCFKPKNKYILCQHPHQMELISSQYYRRYYKIDKVKSQLVNKKDIDEIESKIKKQEMQQQKMNRQKDNFKSVAFDRLQHFDQQIMDRCE